MLTCYIRTERDNGRPGEESPEGRVDSVGNVSAEATGEEQGKEGAEVKGTRHCGESCIQIIYFCYFELLRGRGFGCGRFVGFGCGRNKLLRSQLVPHLHKLTPGATHL